jgi:Zn-dependent protease
MSTPISPRDDPHSDEIDPPTTNPPSFQAEVSGNLDPEDVSTAPSEDKAAAVLPQLTEADLAPPPLQRKTVLPVALFVATCASTFWVGAADFQPVWAMSNSRLARQVVEENWLQGLIYMGAVLAILLTHEMGHFLFTIRYKIPASYPIFIPIPFSPIGTMGAVIGMDGLRADRKQMFDLGLAGPLAGLVVAIPVLWLGILRFNADLPRGGFEFYNPMLVTMLFEYLRPDIVAPQTISVNQLNPLLMAGWVGLLITGLNMLPISQLDGGHVTYALFGKRAHTLARAFVMVAIAYIIIQEIYIWTLMLVLVIMMGTDHPPTSDDTVELGPVREWVGLASLLIPILCFPPQGIAG